MIICIYTDIKIVRAMPNLPASIGFGVTGYCKSQNISEEEAKDVCTLLIFFFSFKGQQLLIK